MKDGTEKYIETVNYLAKLYDYCNDKIFGGELTRPVITVQRDERNKSNGWWSVKKVWKENDIDVWRNQQYRAQCNHFCRKNTKRLCLFGTECTGNDRTDRIYHADLGACHRLSGLQ